MAKNEQSGKQLGKIASKGLKAPSTLTTKEIKALAASVLTQLPDKEQQPSKKK